MLNPLLAIAKTLSAATAIQGANANGSSFASVLKNACSAFSVDISTLLPSNRYDNVALSV